MNFPNIQIRSVFDYNNNCTPKWVLLKIVRVQSISNARAEVDLELEVALGRGACFPLPSSAVVDVIGRSMGGKENVAR